MTPPPQVAATVQKTLAYAHWPAYLGDDGPPANDEVSIDPSTAPRLFAQVVHRQNPLLVLSTDENLIKTKHQLETVSDILQPSMAERADLRFKEIYIDDGEKGEEGVARDGAGRHKGVMGGECAIALPTQGGFEGLSLVSRRYK